MTLNFFIGVQSDFIPYNIKNNDYISKQLLFSGDWNLDLKKNNEGFRSLQMKYLMQCWATQSNYDPIAVDKTDGCWIHTMDGRRIFDLRSAHECINLGFRHPKILQAMREQMEKVVYVTNWCKEALDTFQIDYENGWIAYD